MAVIVSGTTLWENAANLHSTLLRLTSGEVRKSESEHREQVDHLRRQIAALENKNNEILKYFEVIAIVEKEKKEQIRSYKQQINETKKEIERLRSFEIEVFDTSRSQIDRSAADAFEMDYFDRLREENEKLEWKNRRLVSDNYNIRRKLENAEDQSLFFDEYRSEDLNIVLRTKAFSTPELNDAYDQASDVGKSAIISELERRALRVTGVIAELQEKMQYDSDYNVRVVVSRGHNGELSAEFSEDTRGFIAETIEPIVLTETDIQTTMLVGVGLSGANLVIAPKQMIWEVIPDGTENTFSWTVTPKREGTLQMFIDVRNKISIGDKTVELQVRQFPKVITVSVDVWTRLGRIIAGTESAISTAQKFGIVLAALFGFGGIGTFYAGIRAWRKHLGTRTHSS